MSYGLAVWIILDMPFVYWCSFLDKACDIFYHQYLDISKFTFIYKSCGIMFTYKYYILKDLRNLGHQIFVIFWQMFLTYLTTYWQTWMIQLYKHRNLKGSGTWSVLLGRQNISDCIESKPKAVFLVVNWQALLIWNVSLKYLQHEHQNIQVGSYSSLPNLQ